MERAIVTLAAVSFLSVMATAIVYEVVNLSPREILALVIVLALAGSFVVDVVIYLLGKIKERDWDHHEQ